MRVDIFKKLGTKDQYEYLRNLNYQPSNLPNVSVHYGDVRAICIDKKSSLGFSRGNLSNGSGSLSGKGKTGCGGTNGVTIGRGLIGSKMGASGSLPKFSNKPLFLNILFKNAIFNSSFPDNLQKTSSTYRCF